MGSFAPPRLRAAAAWRMGRLDTTSRDKAAEALEGLYGRDAKLHLSPSTAAFRVRFDTAVLGRIRLAKASLTGYGLLRTTGAEVQMTLPVKGRLDVASPRRTASVADQQALSVAGPHERVQHTVASGMGIALYLPLAGLVERAETLTGSAFGAAGLPSEMSEVIAGASPAGQALATGMRGALAELTALDAVGMGGLAVAGCEDTLTNLAVAALLPRVASLLERQQPDSGAGIVRAARDYLAAHALEPVRIAPLAASLGISMRALQESFQRHYGQSPRDFLLARRLEAAHSALRCEPDGRTVTDVAYACGFSDLAHFSSRYRARFGELPSETLRQARNA